MLRFLFAMLFFISSSLAASPQGLWTILPPTPELPKAQNSDYASINNTRAKTEYQQLSTTPSQYSELLKQIGTMWATEPNFSEQQLKSITVPTWIVDGDHDEGIKRENTEYMAAIIPNAGLLILPNVSHFAFIQAPKQFTENVLQFLEQ